VGRSRRTVLCAFLGVFFTSAAAGSVGSAAANAAEAGSDAAGAGDSVRAVAAAGGVGTDDAASVAGADRAPFDTDHIGASERPVDLDVVAAADVPGFVTTHIGAGSARVGGSERAACLNSGAMIEGGFDVPREVRTLPVISGVAGVVVMVGDVRALDVTRDAGSERTTSAVLDGWTFLAGDSYVATGWLFTVGSTNQWKTTAKTA
jgi:hypothetical protein